MVVEAVVGVDGTCQKPRAGHYNYQLSKTEHDRDGKREARLKRRPRCELAYTGAFRARPRAALGGTVIEATPPGIDGFKGVGGDRLEVEKDLDATFQPHGDAVASMRDMGARLSYMNDDELKGACRGWRHGQENDAGCDDGVVEPPSRRPPAGGRRRPDRQRRGSGEGGWCGSSGSR